MTRCWSGIATLAALALAGLTGCGGPAVDAGRYDTVAEAPERDPETARRLCAEAVRLIESGDYEEAEAALKRALSADLTHGPAHNNLGKVYFQTRRYYLAAWEFEYAAKLMRYQPEPKNNLGLVFEAVGELDQAVTHYGDALAMAPDSPEVLGNLARSRIRRGDRGEEVRKLLVELLKKDTRPEWVEWARRELARSGQERKGETKSEHTKDK